MALYEGHADTAGMREDLQGLAVLLAATNFSTAEGSAGAAWFAAQLQYLKHIKRRPSSGAELTGKRKRAEAQPSLTHSPAGGEAFTQAVQTQCADVVANGVVASYRCKLWAVVNKRSVSLGTVGTERLWRNDQRAARNKARARADFVTRNMLVRETRLSPLRDILFQRAWL